MSPGSPSPLLRGVPQGLFSAVHAIVRDRVAEAGGYTTGALFGAVSRALPLLRDWGITADQRRIAFAIVQFVALRDLAGTAFQETITPPPVTPPPGAPPPAPPPTTTIPINPGLEPEEVRINLNIEVVVPAEGEEETRQVYVTIRRRGVPASLDDLLADILHALEAFAASYDLERLEELIIPDSLRITSIERGV